MTKPIDVPRAMQRRHVAKMPKPQFDQMLRREFATGFLINRALRHVGNVMPPR
ncbi:MAG: hypothetical protein MI741_08020 [Rhodospirillales bacterium]|nr:hypothetical protein [Rhodospirillales bacterium]